MGKHDGEILDIPSGHKHGLKLKKSKPNRDNEVRKRSTPVGAHGSVSAAAAQSQTTEPVPWLHLSWQLVSTQLAKNATAHCAQSDVYFRQFWRHRLQNDSAWRTWRPLTLTRRRNRLLSCNTTGLRPPRSSAKPSLSGCQAWNSFEEDRGTWYLWYLSRFWASLVFLEGVTSPEVFIAPSLSSLQHEHTLKCFSLVCT